MTVAKDPIVNFSTDPARDAADSERREQFRPGRGVRRSAVRQRLMQQRSRVCARQVRCAPWSLFAPEHHDQAATRASRRLRSGTGGRSRCVFRAGPVSTGFANDGGVARGTQDAPYIVRQSSVVDS
jgi:hypothetical protein